MANYEDNPNPRENNKAFFGDWVGNNLLKGYRYPVAINNCKFSCGVSDKNGKIFVRIVISKKSCEQVGCCSWGGAKCQSDDGKSQGYEIVEDQREQRKY